MHELFSQVLTKKDLSKAGELFSLEDADIKNDLTEVLDRICDIAQGSEYASNDNDQSVVEICITRVTSAIRWVVKWYPRFQVVLGMTIPSFIVKLQWNFIGSNPACSFTMDESNPFLGLKGFLPNTIYG